MLDEFYTVFLPYYFCPKTHSRAWSDTKFKDAYTRMRLLEDLTYSANHLWWNCFFLKQYFQFKISPRGLRVLKGCSFLDTDLRTEWEEVAVFCTQKWIKILISHRDQHYCILRQKIESHITSLHLAHPLLPIDWLRTFKINTKKSEDSTIQNKLGTFRRDLDDYTHKRVFNWKRKRDSTHSSPPPLIPLSSLSHLNIHSDTATLDHPTSCSLASAPVNTVPISSRTLSIQPKDKKFATPCSATIVNTPIPSSPTLPPIIEPANSDNQPNTSSSCHQDHVLPDSIPPNASMIMFGASPSSIPLPFFLVPTPLLSPITAKTKRKHVEEAEEGGTQILIYPAQTSFGNYKNLQFVLSKTKQARTFIIVQRP